MDAAAPGFRASRTAGYWLAAVMAVLQAVNAARTLADPSGFAGYMGLPLDQLASPAWVQVYGLRAAFVALITLILLVRKDFAALRWMAIAAIVMPLGDASLAAQADAPLPIIARHLAIAAFLVVAWHFLGRATRAQANRADM